MTKERPPHRYDIRAVRRYADTDVLKVQGGECPLGHGALQPVRGEPHVLDQGIGGWCPSCGQGWFVPVGGCLFALVPPS